MSQAQRQIDGLGRIVIPKEMRSALKLAPGDPLQIFTHKSQIVLQRYVNKCTFCGGTKDLYELFDQHVCRVCRQGLAAEHRTAQRFEQVSTSR